jgi:hypothetical protein
MNRFKVITVAVTLLALLAVPVVNRRIRASLAAPRLRETGVPDGLPWREVHIPTERGKTLFGWFIPAGEAAPALAVVHGWGGNAEMMLPLAGPLHAAGYTRVQSEVRLWIRRPVDVWTANSGPTPGWHGRHAAPACAWRFSVSTKRRPA